MTRRFTSLLALLGVCAFIGFDLAQTPPNPYQAPPLFAYGSGLAAVGGFCGSLPE